MYVQADIVKHLAGMLRPQGLWCHTLYIYIVYPHFSPQTWPCPYPDRPTSFLLSQSWTKRETDREIVNVYATGMCPSKQWSWPHLVLLPKLL